MEVQAVDRAPAVLRFEGDPGSVRSALAEARRRTWDVASGFSGADLRSPACGHLSPPVWDLGHISNFEELWLVQRLAGRPEMKPGNNDTYDAMRHPRSERPRLDLLDREGAEAYMAAVRAETLAVLDHVDLDSPDPLLHGGFAYWMLVLHEHQHQETLLQSAVMRGPGRYSCFTPPRPFPERVPSETPAQWGADPPSSGRAGTDAGRPDRVPVPAGPLDMGCDHGPGAYDNEAPRHTVHVDAFRLARFPVTCGAYLEFVAAGGYEEPRWWGPEGRAWLEERSARAPLYWQQRDGAWWRRSLRDGWKPVEEAAQEILCHVTWHEADAYARFRGARLPTEAEWEKACRMDLETGRARRNPWGDTLADPSRANVDHTAWGPSEAGSHRAGASACGAEHMVGDVWEWTATEFRGYPGFRAFPYQEYSEAFFEQGYRVLRGGSWATRPGCATGTFRNWDHPHRRQIFSGIRLAWDA